MLRQGLLIKDSAFTGNNHGEYIHMFQMDFLIKVARDAGLDPKIVQEFYRFMGQRRKISEDGNSFELWELLFDQTNQSFYSPRA